MNETISNISLQSLREYAIQNEPNVKRPDFESTSYFYHRWIRSGLPETNHWTTENIAEIRTGDLILYPVTEADCFYRYGMVAKVFYGTVVTTREVFVVYDLGPAVTMATDGQRAIFSPLSFVLPMKLCKGLTSQDNWIMASRENFELLLGNVDTKIQLRIAKEKMDMLESLLKR